MIGGEQGELLGVCVPAEVVARHADGEGAAHRWRSVAHPDQEEADEALGAGGEGLDVDHAPRGDPEATEQHHPRPMPEAPAKACSRGEPRVPRGQRRQGGEVVGT